MNLAHGVGEEALDMLIFMVAVSETPTYEWVRHVRLVMWLPMVAFYEAWVVVRSETLILDFCGCLDADLC